jgi:hypothetical protein
LIYFGNKNGKLNLIGEGSSAITLQMLFGMADGGGGGWSLLWMI